MRIIKTVSLLVILIGGLSFGITCASKHRKIQTTPPDFKIVYSHTAQRPGQATKLFATSVRFVKPGDRWKEITTYYKEDGTTRQQIGIGNAEFDVDDPSGKNQPQSGIWTAGIPSAEQLRKDPQFVREDTLLGYKVFVMRITTPNNPDRYTDFYMSPEFIKTFLKTVSHYDDGAESIIGPTEIQVGPISAKDLENPT